MKMSYLQQFKTPEREEETKHNEAGLDWFMEDSWDEFHIVKCNKCEISYYCTEHENFAQHTNRRLMGKYQRHTTPQKPGQSSAHCGVGECEEHDWRNEI